MKTLTVRPGIAMVELIFSIVIMGIVMMSAPMLLSTASKSSTVALQQEGIHQAVSRLNMILTYSWDQNDTNDSCISPTLIVDSGDSELEDYNSSGRRIGVPKDSQSHTFLCGSEELKASETLGIEGTTKDDIDDFGDTSLTLDTSGSGSDDDYIETATVSIATSVSYVSDSANYNSKEFSYNFPKASVANSSNIKRLQVKLTSTSGVDELEKNIVMDAFSCNIGGYEYESREF